jgi:hypothetical protein
VRGKAAIVIGLLVLTLGAGCGGKGTTDAERILDATDPTGECTFVDQVCKVTLGHRGKTLEITLQDGSKLTIWATYWTRNGNYIEDCIDDEALSEGDWIDYANKKGDVEMTLPVTSCD